MGAVVEAAKIRLRPILMTSFSTIFGVMPIALGLGAGAESRRPLGIAIVGGILFSTFLTLVLVPVVYSYLARFSKVRRRDELLAAEVGKAAAISGEGAVAAAGRTKSEAAMP